MNLEHEAELTPQSLSNDERTAIALREKFKKRRCAQIQRFKDSQLRTRQWINFGEIADWCSEEDQSIFSSEPKRIAAFRKLAADLSTGDFEANGRSRVLYLSIENCWARKNREEMGGIRMTPSWFIRVEKAFGFDLCMVAYLECCWIDRPLFTKWLSKHRLDPAPARFEPDRSANVHMTGQLFVERVQPREIKSDADIKRAICEILDLCANQRVKAPNPREMAGMVEKLFQSRGLTVVKDRVEKLATEIRSNPKNAYNAILLRSGKKRAGNALKPVKELKFPTL